MGATLLLMQNKSTNGPSAAVRNEMGFSGPARIHGTIAFEPTSVFGTAEVDLEISLDNGTTWTVAEGLMVSTAPVAVPFDFDCERFRLNVRLANGATNLTARVATVAPVILA